MIVLVRLSLEIALDLFLDQPEVQLPQRIGTEAATVVGGIVADQRDGIELVGDAIKADGGGGGVVMDTFGAQGLEEKERFQRGVGSGQARHELGEGGGRRTGVARRRRRRRRRVDVGSQLWRS